MSNVSSIEKLFHIKTPKSAPALTTLPQIDRVRNMMLGLPIPVATRNSKLNLPVGYKFSKKHPGMLEPIEEHFRFLLRAKLYLKQSSFAEVATWLSDKLGQKITAMTLFRIMNNRCPLDEIALPIEKRMELAGMNHAFDDRKKEIPAEKLLKQLEKEER